MEEIYQISLTAKEKARLETVFGANIDLNLVPEMNKAATRNQTERVLELAETIKFDKELLTKLWGL